jgi:hypothetical protein
VTDDPFDPEDPVAVPLGGTLDLHTFRPSDVGALVPDWLAASREAGHLTVRVVHGKGTGALRAGVLALLERSPLVRATAGDGNWGGVVVHLHDPAGDEGRVRAILAASPRFRAALAALAEAGPPGAWLGAGALRNRVWHALHRRPGEADDTDLDVAWHGPGDPAADAAWTARLRARLDVAWEVVDQARYGAPSAEAGLARWPETATAIGARLRPGRAPDPADPDAVELCAPHGLGDLVGMVVRPVPGFDPAAWRARLAAKQWRRRFPWVRVE